MKQRVLIVSHSDADGHVIAEQVRRNLDKVPSFDVSMVVDPRRTSGHRLWTKLEQLHEIESNDIVFFVDLMFAPASFAAEADSLVQFVNDRPDKLFFLIDHHPLPNRRLSDARNLSAVYKRDVLDCTFGNSSWMMVIAALLEKQPTRAKQIKTPIHDELAAGVRRAAAVGGPLPGEKLMALMRFDRWHDLLELGREERTAHRLPRGRRASGGKESVVLAKLDRLATELLSTSPPTDDLTTRAAMSYDFEIASDRLPPKAEIEKTEPGDLETIVTLLELAAVMLTKGPDSTFTVDALLQQAQALAGGEVVLNEDDVKNVLGKAGFLKKLKGGSLALK